MAYQYPPKFKDWEELPALKAGTSDDKVSVVAQCILNAIFMVFPFLAIVTRGRKRRRLLMATLWAMVASTLLSLAQEGAMERFKHNWHEGQKPDTKMPWEEPAMGGAPKTTEPKPKITGYGWDT